MHKYYLLLLLAAISFCTYGQRRSKADTEKIVKYFNWTDKIEHVKLPEYNQSLLSDLESNRDTVLLQNFLSAYFDGVTLFSETSYQPKNPVKYLYSIDLNGDQMLDVIYQGPTGGEPTITQIYLNYGDCFKKVFTGFQYIVDIKFNKNRLVSFRLYNNGCCADPQTVEYDYTITYENNEPIFSLSKTSGYFYPTEKTRNTLNPASYFTITRDTSNLRKECYFFDGIEHPVTGGEGNIIAKYGKGAIGKAIGYKKDGEEEWIFVLMVSPNKIESCEFSTFMEQPTEVYGWLLRTDTDLK